MSDNAIVPADYGAILGDLKQRVRQAQIRAVLSVNAELVRLYWSIGRTILEQQEQNGWGAKVIGRLSADLKREFPEMGGLSPRNLKYMRRFAEVWSDEPWVQQPAAQTEFVQAPLAQITWYHHIALLEKLDSRELRLWYAGKTVENGWSRNVLVHQIETGLHQRLGASQTNFARVLPAPQSDLAQQLLKDPYVFDFLTLADDARERDLERGLIEHIRDFLLELGQGWAFVGSQYHLQIGAGTDEEADFYLDLLFYHLKLRCYVVIDLKTEPFSPEHAGKMNFYLAVADDLLKTGDDAPTIGLILCKTKSRLQVEYALRGQSAPLGVSSFEILESLPPNLQNALPTVEQLEAELGEKESENV